MADMRGLLQPAAPGLLSMLALKQRGFNPNTLSDTVTPVLDLTRWYHADTPVVVQGRVDVVNATDYCALLAFSIPQIVVPDNEIWYVRDFSVTFNVDPATATGFEVFQLAPAILLRQEGIFNRHRLVGNSAPPVTAFAAAIPPIGVNYQSPSLQDVWAPPGAAFGAAFTGYGNDAVSTPFLEGTANVLALLI